MSAQYRDLMAQYEDLRILGRVGPGEQYEPAQHSGEHEVGESERHSERSCGSASGRWSHALVAAKALVRVGDTVLGTHTPMRGRATTASREE
jgi:hypothetical protein